jgi:hypothetical protein
VHRPPQPSSPTTRTPQKATQNQHLQERPSQSATDPRPSSATLLLRRLDAWAV